jgi:hypothetical protein
MEICVDVDEILLLFRVLAVMVVQRHTPTGRVSAIGVE